MVGGKILSVWERIGLAFLYLLLSMAAFLTIFPFVWSAILATRNRSEIFNTEISFIPGTSLLENYSQLLDSIPFWVSMYNSFYVTVMGTLFSILFCSMGGYAFAMYQFKGKNFLFGTMLVTMMIPPVLALIPYYLIIQFLGLINTHLAVWLPFTTAPIGIFLVRQYCASTIPKDLMEAARLDGAGELRIYWSIALPLMRPVLGTLAIFQFVFFWNNFITPLVALTSPDMYVVTLALRTLQWRPNTPWGGVMLGTTISILPVVITYLFASRQMMSGLTGGAVKG